MNSWSSACRQLLLKLVHTCVAESNWTDCCSALMLLMMLRMVVAEVNFQLGGDRTKSSLSGPHLSFTNLPLTRSCRLETTPTTSNTRSMSDYAVPRPGGTLKFKGDSDKCVSSSPPPFPPFPSGQWLAGLLAGLLDRSDTL